MLGKTSVVLYNGNMIFSIALLFYLLIYGFTLFASIVVVYHFRRFGIRKDYPGKIFFSIIFLVSIGLAVINLGFLTGVRKLEPSDLNFPLMIDFQQFNIPLNEEIQ